jgi:arylsulfatase
VTQKLPKSTPEFGGDISRIITDSTPQKLNAQTAPDGAPNILLIMLDDVGFGSFGNFGGPVTTPGLD